MEKEQIQNLKESFKRDGFILIPDFYTPEEVRMINEKLEAFIQNVVPDLPSTKVFYEDKTDLKTLKQMQDLNEYDPFFSKILNNSRFSEIAEILLETKVIGKTLEYFNKPPKIGKPTPPHQDGYYFMLDPPAAVTMWMAMEDVDQENGCIRYLRGSHLTGMRPHGRSQTLGFSQGITDYGENDLAKEIAMPAKPGTLLIHHALTVHRADRNSSNSRTRKAIGFIYFSESAREDVEAKTAYQKKLADELSGKALI
jgi:phytanoyl-CoA hydroxylase